MTAIRKKEISELMTPFEDVEMDNKWIEIKKICVQNKRKISEKITSWMEKNKIGVVKFCKMFGISTNQYYRLIDEEANVSLVTLAEIAQTLNIRFDIIINPNLRESKEYEKNNFVKPIKSRIPKRNNFHQKEEQSTNKIPKVCAKRKNSP